jgi:DNA-binding XRE family transcriptional regulator
MCEERCEMRGTILVRAPGPRIDQKTLGDRLRARRTKLGLSQKALAAACAMSQQSVANIDAYKPRLLIELASA